MYAIGRCLTPSRLLYIHCILLTIPVQFDMMGENCDACERIYIHEDIYDEFVAAFVETVEGFVVGDPLDEDT